ncbi:MAG: T9SS type A sorting domain-containing protein [Bacteroidetes bacterium]|nr:T9SS type A sorting domain-containing protein [Bacteroidota bacterium]
MIKISNQYITGGNTDSLTSGYGCLTIVKYDSLGRFTGLYNYYDTTDTYSSGSFRRTAQNSILASSLMKSGTHYYCKITEFDLNGNIVNLWYTPKAGELDTDSSIVTIINASLNSDSLYPKRTNFFNDTSVDYSSFVSPFSTFYDLLSDKIGNILACGTQNIFGREGCLSKSVKLGQIGIDEISTPISIEFFPNPSKESVHFHLDKLPISQGMYSVSIINSSSQIVRSVSTINSSDFTIDLYDLARGIYFFKITMNCNKIASGKLILN